MHKMTFVYTRRERIMYPQFIKNEPQLIFNKRGELRWQCFEEEGYRSLLDVLIKHPNDESTQNGTFLYYNDPYILMKYITNGQSGDDIQAADYKQALTKAIEEHKNDSDINWKTLYKYLDERREQNILKSHQKVCDEVFAQFDGELNNNAFCLY